MKLELVNRPDTDEAEYEEQRFYSKWDNLVFVECLECQKKPGTPPLCKPCLHNRNVISMLRAIVEKAREAVPIIFEK